MMRVLGLACLIWSALCFSTFAQNSDVSLAQSVAADPQAVIDTRIVDTHKFYGLAAYYNEAYLRIVDADGMDTPEAGPFMLEAGDWLNVVGRFDVLVIRATGLRGTISEDGALSFDNPQVLTRDGASVDIVSKPDLKAYAAPLNRIRYSHLIAPIRWLCLLLEATLVALNGVIGIWALSIVAIALLIRLALLPLSRLVSRLQTRVSQTQTALAPRLAEIKRTMKGEAAHKAFVAAHKEQSVTTFYALKPMIGLLVQVPVWIAIFNVLAEMPQLRGHGFLWVKDLAYPDAVASFGTAIPLIGDTLNLMPLLMTLVTIASTLHFRDGDALPAVLRRQKRNLFFMAAAFLILFYPFPSGMVFYWTLANILNFASQLFKRRRA